MAGQREHHRNDRTSNDWFQPLENDRPQLQPENGSRLLQRTAINNFQPSIVDREQSRRSPGVQKREIYGQQRLSNMPSIVPALQADNQPPAVSFNGMQQQTPHKLQHSPMTPPHSGEKIGSSSSSYHGIDGLEMLTDFDKSGSTSEKSSTATNMRSSENRTNTRTGSSVSASIETPQIATRHSSPKSYTQDTGTRYHFRDETLFGRNRQTWSFDNISHGNSYKTGREYFGSPPPSLNIALDSTQDVMNLRGHHDASAPRGSCVPAQYPSSHHSQYNMTRREMVKDEADITKNLASLVISSRPYQRQANRTTHLSPFKSPQHMREFVPAVDTFSTGLHNRVSSPSGLRLGITKYINKKLSCSDSEDEQYEARVNRVTNSLAATIPENVLHVAAAVQAKIDALVQQHEPGFLQQFRPSNSALKIVGLLQDGRSQVSPDRYGSSNNYQGDITIAHNQSANIPDHENCAVWVLGLPPHTTHADLLGSIRGVGQIYASVINPPTGQHQTAASKIVFFEREQAEAFMSLVFNGRFYVMGRQIRHARWNKIKSARYIYTACSRAIRLTGPGNLMDFGFFEVFFKTRFTYELEGAREVHCAIPGMVSHEWRFGSLRCQSASAKTSVERELRGIFSVEWARDPCM